MGLFFPDIPHKKYEQFQRMQILKVLLLLFPFVLMTVSTGNIIQYGQNTASERNSTMSRN